MAAETRTQNRFFTVHFKEIPAQNCATPSGLLCRPPSHFKDNVTNLQSLALNEMIGNPTQWQLRRLVIQIGKVSASDHLAQLITDLGFTITPFTITTFQQEIGKWNFIPNFHSSSAISRTFFPITFSSFLASAFNWLNSSFIASKSARNSSSVLPSSSITTPTYR